MSRLGTELRLVLRLTAALPALALVTLLLAPAAPVNAAGTSFGKPEAKVVYGDAITFSVPITVGEPLRRVEVRLRYPGASALFVDDLPAPASGTRTLTYRLETTGGAHMVPNTTVEATFAAIPADGSAPILAPAVEARYADTGHEWQTLRGKVVVVHWYQGGRDFAQRAADIGDKAIEDTASLLGVSEDKPVDFYVYGDDASFLAALGPGTRENVAGQAHPDIRTLFALITPDQINDSWVGVVVPHELVHLVFDTAVKNPYRFPPRWFNEGLAVYLSEGYTAYDRGLVTDAVSSRELSPLPALAGQFPADSPGTYLAYAESASAIEYIARTFGTDGLVRVIDAYATGLSDDDAFRKGIGVDFASFQEQWYRDLGAAEPQAYGPAANAPGPVPPGWDAPAGETPTAAPSAGSAAATARPTPTAGTAGPSSPSGAGGGSDADRALLVAALGLVVLVVVVGMVLARRRMAPP